MDPEKNYEFVLKKYSKNGLQSKSWGPAYWYVLYTFAANYAPLSGGDSPTAVEKHNAIQFLYYFGQNLPCGKCRKNFPKNQKIALRAFDNDTDQVFKNRNNLFKYVYLLHESVNKMINKGKLAFSQKKARCTIEGTRARNCKGYIEGCNDSKNLCKLHLKLEPPKSREAKNKLKVSEKCRLG